jgi:hypothetical protein
MSELDPIEIEIPIKGPAPAPEIDIGAELKAGEPGAKQGAPKADDGIELLKRQLEEKRREADEARRQKIEAERIAQQRELEANTYKTQIDDSQHVALTNAIASFERDAEMLERDYASLLEQGEYQRAAKVQRQMAQIEARLSTLQQGREELEYRLKQPPQPQHQQSTIEQPQARQMPRDNVEDRIAGLSPPSQQWIRANRQVVEDPKKANLLSAAHFEAVANDIQVDSPDYFAFLEQKLGIGSNSAALAAPRQAPARVPMGAAPVSRSSGVTISGNGKIANVTLTPAEREAARDMDMSEEEYAESKLYYMQKGAYGR